MYQYSQPLEVNDFSGGKNDNYIDGPLNAGQEFDNLRIQKNKKPKTRPGRTFYISAAQAQLPSGNQRIGALIKHLSNVNLFAVSARKIYHAVSSVWTEITGPVSSNAALSVNATTNYLSWSDWRGHTFVTGDGYPDVVKLYKDESGNTQVRTAGLPSLDLEGAIDLANDLKSKYNLHRVNTSEHTAGADSINSVSAADAVDFDSLATLVAELITDYTAHNADAALGAGWLYHAAQNATSHTLASTTTPTTLTEITTALDDLRTKYNAHDADGTSHGTDTAHQVTAQRLPQLSGTAGTEDFIYRFVYYYQYYVSEVLHEDFGPTTEVTLDNVTSGTKSVTNIPAIDNGTFRCYDTANIKVKIYRTINAGTNFFYVGEVTNGTTTFSDTVSDATLVDNVALYTEGGVQENDTPPKAKYFVAVNDIGIYANLKIGTKEYPNSFISSKPGDIDSVPGENQDEVEFSITGCSSYQTYPILFGRNRIVRLEGIIDEQGRGAIAKKEVSRTKGTISNNSIVQIPEGLVFAGEDGFYFCDGFQPPQILSIHLIESYKELVTSTTYEKKIYGEYDSLENRVLWTCTSDTSASDNNTTFILDLNFGIKSDSVFVTDSGQGTCFRPTALAFYNKEMVQADARGYIFKYDDDVATDPKVDTSVSASSWNTYAIIADYKSCSFNMGSDAFYKWVPLITASFKNEVNTTISIKSNNEDSGLFRTLKEIRARESITWGDPNIIWGDTSFDYLWNVAQVITAKRRFPAGQMRCLLKQIEITNADSIIYNSDTYGDVNIDSSLNTATLTGSLSWPSDIVDYTISFETDAYVAEYTISTRDSDTQLTFSDPNGEVDTASSVSWVIRGYKKGELINIISYALRFAPIGQVHTTYKGENGENA